MPDLVAPGLYLLHVVGGGLALLLGPIAMHAEKRIGVHSRVGLLFFIVVLAVSASGGTLAVVHWQDRWPFLFIAIGTVAFALLGYAASKRRWRHWLVAHVIGQGSAYTAMVTAFVVSNWDSLTGAPGEETALAFLAPMLVGTLAVGWLAWEVHRGRRPRRSARRRESDAAMTVQGPMA